MKDSRICHPKTRPLPHKDYFELKAIEEKKKRYKKSSLPSSICLKARYQFIIKVINCIMFIYIYIYIYIYLEYIYRRKRQPTPVFLPGESQGQGSLVDCRLWGRRGSDTTEAT